jgi:hypothetical protein
MLVLSKVEGSHIITLMSHIVCCMSPSFYDTQRLEKNNLFIFF